MGRRDKKDKEYDRKREKRTVDKEESNKQRDKEDRKNVNKYDKFSSLTNKRSEEKKSDRSKVKSNKEPRLEKY